MTKQAVSELVGNLEAHACVARVPDPTDGRTELVRPTPRGGEVVAIARGLVPELERRISDVLGTDRAAALREDLEAIRRVARG